MWSLAGCSPPSFLGTDLSKCDILQNEGRFDFSVRCKQLLLWLNLSDPSLLLHNLPVGVLSGVTNTPSALLQFVSAELLAAAAALGSMAHGLDLQSRVSASHGLCSGPWFLLVHHHCPLHARAGPET